MYTAAHEQRIALVPDLTAVRTARAFVRAACVDVLPDRAVATASLLTSELVSNAVLHAGSAPELVVSTSTLGLRVEVADGSHVCPRASTAEPGADHGRGLMFVDQLASRWGVDITSTGKCVWFELAS